MTLQEVKEVVSRVKLGGPFADKWFYVGDVKEITPGPHQPGPLLGVTFIQVRYMEPDIYTGIPAEQRARVWIVAPDATESQVVQICFGAALASAEHQCREFFTYEVDGQDRRVFGPHMEIADLASVAR